MESAADGSLNGDERRRLITPARGSLHRDHSVAGHSHHTRMRSRSRERSRSRLLREREREVERERERVHRMERDLQRERDEDNRRRRSELRYHSSRLRGSEQRDPPEQEQGPRGTGERLRRGSAAGQRSQRSCSPTFSTKDILTLLNSIKGGFASGLSNQNAASNSKSLDYKNILPDFNPATKNQRIDVWLKKVNECASVYSWDEKTTVHFAMQKLQGLAKTWYESLNSILFSWSEWQEKLLSAFPCEQNYGQLLEDMLRRKSKFNEPIEVYYYEKLSLLNQCEITGRRAVDCIIHGISDRTMKSSALALRCNVPDQLLQFLLSNRESLHTPPALIRNRNAHENIIMTDRGQSSRWGSRPGPVGGVYCFNCKERGHPFLQCSKPLIKCDRCNRVGHKAENCSVRQEKGVTNADPIKKTMCISNLNPNSKFFKFIFVNGSPLEAFIDLGSEVTLVRESMVSELALSHDGQQSKMKGFGNGLVQSLGSVLLTLVIDGVSAVVSCRVVKDCLLDRPILVGQTFSEQAHIIVVKDSHKLQFLDIGAEVPNPNPSQLEEGLARISFTGCNWIYGAASVRATTEPTFTGNVLLNSKIVGKPNEQYIVCGGVYKVKNGSVVVTLTPCSIPCLLQKNCVFSRGERVEVVNRINEVSPDISLKPQDHFNEKALRLGDSVATDDKVRLVDLLHRYEHCFAYDLKGLGCTDVTEMKIELINQRPVVYRPYRLSHHERDQVRGMISEMLEAGVIRESVSSYASPIILVKKKDGTTRMCIDYRMLNSITIKERYPMPVIEDEIIQLSGQAWFITLDLTSGYYQVPIAEQSKYLTAFVTPDGQYEFNRMPFGLANAPAVFQRMMNHVLGSARFNKATVYIDDLLVFGTSAKQCLDRLEEVLQLLEKASLKLNLSKCSFLQNKIDYLGYEIDSEGMRPGKNKIQCVVDFPKPENVHGVRQFLGLASYFRKFIQGFAQLASPLTKLLKKGVAWEWTQHQDESFKSLKARLIERPVLAIFDPAAETELHTDASRVGIGGILLQRRREGDSFQPVAFYSRQTTPEEKNFHSYELETLAVVCSLKKLRVYLLGKEFKIVTDCSALRSTFQKRDLIPRIARWWLALQEFDCSVEYRAGSKMSHVDALSRNPSGEGKDLMAEQYPLVMVISDEDWLLTLQMGDPELCRIRNILESDLDSKGLEYIRNNYVMRDNKLFRNIGDENDVRWVVPKGARWQLCRMNHDEIGHLGFEKTLERMKKNYWFSKMSRFVKKYVAACIECAYAKKANTSREGLLHPIEKIEIPFHTLHMDHVGPFVKSKRGNTHILVVIDGFTKFIFIKPVRNTKTENVIKVLDDIFNTFRAPERIISDRGSCFTSHTFKRFCLDKGVRHILNTVASPRSNGQVERYNRTILDCLTAQNLKDNEKEWDNKLGKIQWGLNNTKQKTIGRTLAEIMFGTSMNSEVNPALNEIADNTRAREGRDLASIRDEVKERIDEGQEYQKQYYDKGKRHAHSYSRGDLVKITKTTFRNNGKSKKLLPWYEGPLRIVKILGHDRYKVAPIPGFVGMKNKRKTTVAADRMQPWIHVAALEVNDDLSDAMNDE